VIRTDTLEQMFDVAELLANQPAPGGDRVAIITNAGGLGILCADTCEANGLKVQPLSEATKAKLREFLPPEASVENPVDMIASASDAEYEGAIRTVAGDPDVDAVIVIYIPPQVEKAAAIVRAIARAVRDVGGSIPVATTLMGGTAVESELRADGTKIPSFSFPEQAAMAIARAAAYGRWRSRPEGNVPRFDDVRRDEAYAVIAAALGRGGGWLTAEELEELLGCYGLPVARSARAATPDEAAAAASGLGGPVALKALGRDIVHKTDVGAVRLGLAGPDDVIAAAKQMARRIDEAGLTMEGFLVQEMVTGGVEMLVGVAQDPLFGPIVACSAGGAAAELLRDVSVGIAPITDLDASEMVRSLKTFPLLDGYRGAPKADVAALEEVILRVSTMVDAHPSIAEMDCNPVMVLPHGAVIVDARVRVQESAAPKPLASRATVG
jgi:acyl-CoA synthetase (NDP forming)